MHTEDTRYKKYEDGQKIELEWINGPINATIIKDEAVDMEFGTGVMTITPWHDITDFDIAERHNLEKEQIIDLKGKLLPIAGDLDGVHIKKARALVVEKLSKKGLVEKIDTNYLHSIALNSRGGGIIEPLIMMIPIFTALPRIKPEITAKIFWTVEFIIDYYCLIMPNIRINHIRNLSAFCFTVKIVHSNWRGHIVRVSALAGKIAQLGVLNNKVLSANGLAKKCFYVF